MANLEGSNPDGQRIRTKEAPVVILPMCEKSVNVMKERPLKNSSLRGTPRAASDQNQTKNLCFKKH